LLLLLVAALPTRSDDPPARKPPRTELTKEEQAKVDDAIQRGMEYLEKHQNRDGTWGDKPSHPLGYTALPALTLLECGMPATDTTIRKAAGWVRANARKYETTYEIALAILLLDRLKDPGDRALLHTLAMRLIAGQTSTGGWSYKCPTLTPTQEQQLTASLWHLQSLKRELIELPTVQDPSRPLQTGVQVEYIPRQALDPSGNEGTRSPGQDSIKGPSPSGDPKQETKPDGQKPPAEKPAQGKPPARKDPPAPPMFPGWNNISEAIKKLPVVRDRDTLPVKDPDKKPQEPLEGTTDNSNTQFAILAVWTARRHQVPVDRTLELIAKRFRISQNLDGNWDYHFFNGGSNTHRPAMTCVGLLGLAVGYGIPVDGTIKNPPRWALKKPEEDPIVKAGLQALSRQVGQPSEQWDLRQPANLYLLWSIERVGMLYKLKTIQDKPWYRWGAEILVGNQHPDGNWNLPKGYHGHSITIDTCLALLFLKKANLAEDLTRAVAFTPKPQALMPDPPELIQPPTLVEEPAPPPPPPAPTRTEERVAAWKLSWTWVFWVLGVLILVGGCGIAYRLATVAEGSRRVRRARTRPLSADRPQRVRKAPRA
jgi:hypothetical protein